MIYLADRDSESSSMNQARGCIDRAPRPMCNEWTWRLSRWLLPKTRIGAPANHRTCALREWYRQINRQMRRASSIREARHPVSGENEHCGRRRSLTACQDAHDDGITVPS